MMRSFFVTGGNKGIGLALTRRILLEVQNAFVFLGSRDLERGKSAFEELKKESTTIEDRVKVIPIDVANHHSIMEAKELVETYLKQNSNLSPLEGIVNNAGVYYGFSLKEMYKVNVYGVLHVTDAFSSLIKENGRVVNVSSRLGPWLVDQMKDDFKTFFSKRDISWKELEDLMNKTTESNEIWKEMGIKLNDVNEKAWYSISKAFCNSLTIIQAREFKHLKINSCMPGYIFTDMTKHKANGDFNEGKKLGMKSTQEGTISAFYLLTDPKVETTGRYYEEDATLASLNSVKN